MKRLVIPCLVLTVFWCACTIPGLLSNNLDFRNNSNQSVRYISLLETIIDSLSEDIVYPDTALPRYWSFSPRNKIVHPMETVGFTEIHQASFKPFFDYYHADTLSIFVLDAEMMNTTPWDTIVSQYLVLQRFDLSVYDANQLNTIVFPPDSTMKDIHMWPPYGTYNDR